LADENVNSVSQFLTGAWGTLIGLLIGTIGLIAAVVFYFKAKREKLPRYSMRSFNFFQGLTTHVPFLTIHFQGHGEPIATLTRTKIVLWNAGKETINKSDVVDIDPVRVKAAAGCTLLDAEVAYANNPANQFEVNVNREKTQATVTFKYIDKNQGAVLQLFHTGPSHSSLEIAGSIKGASLKEVTEEVPFLFAALIFMAYGLIVGSVFMFADSIIRRGSGEPMPLTVEIFIGIVAGFYIRKYQEPTYRAFGGGVPKTFRRYFS
jgi:hypothetical protein